MNTDYLIKDYMPRARWSVGGGLLHGRTMLQLCEGIAQEMRDIRSLSYLHATPSCAWSLDWAEQRSLTTPTGYLRMLQLAAATQQAVCLNFDNPFVAKAMLEDGFGLFLVNELLQHNPTGLNCVAVADDRVAMELRRQFPSLRLNAHMNRSVCEESEPDAAFYNRLLDFYQEVQLYPDCARNPELVRSLSKPERCWVIVNDRCRRGSRAAHREMLLLLAQMRVRPYEFSFKVRRQQQMETLLSPPGAPGNTFSRDELKALYAAGLRSFHVQAEQYRNGMTPAWLLMSYLVTAAPQYSNMRALLTYKVLSYLNGEQPSLASGLEPFSMRWE